MTNAENQKRFYDKTQEIPANLTARNYASKEGNELTKAVISQFENAQPMPNIPEMAEVWEPGANMFFNVASGKEEASKAAKEAAKLLRKLLNKNTLNKAKKGGWDKEVRPASISVSLMKMKQILKI